jgi:hypothetical protein
MPLRGFERIDGQRGHGNIRLRIHRSQWYPDTVFQAVMRLQMGIPPGASQSASDFPGQFGEAVDRILNVVERLGKTAEVMDRFRHRGCGDNRRLGHEMCRCGHDDVRSWQAITQDFQEIVHAGALDRHHWRAMRDEPCGERGGVIHGDQKERRLYAALLRWRNSDPITKGLSRISRKRTI